MTTIKKIIEDLAFDKISLNQAMTQSKIVAYKTKNQTFISWIKNELEGYEIGSNSIPNYRKINTTLKLKFFDYQNNKDIFVPFLFNLDDTELTSELNNNLNILELVEPITIFEQFSKKEIDEVIHYELPPESIITFSKLNEKIFKLYKNQIKGIVKEFGVSQFHSTLESVKQKLLDMLLELDSEFPDLENEYLESKQSVEKIQNIITNNIYGNNNPTNIASGQTIEQKEISFNLNLDEIKLKELGLNDNEINELREISRSSNSKNTFREKTIKWLGSVSSSFVARELADKLPQLIDYINTLT